MYLTFIINKNFNFCSFRVFAYATLDSLWLRYVNLYIKRIQLLLDSATEDLFCKMKSSNHCLRPLLPPDRTLNQLPTCSFNLHKKFFVISYLFKFLTWVRSCFLCVFSCLNFFLKCFSNFHLSRLTFSFNFCPLLLLATNYCDVYKSITACKFVAAFNKLYCIVLYCIVLYCIIIWINK